MENDSSGRRDDQYYNDPRYDEEIRDEMREMLFDRLEQEGDSLSVGVNAGVITLGGTVRTHETKDLAERWAAEIPGVTEIRNEIDVSTGIEGLRQEPPEESDSSKIQSSGERDLF